MELWAWWSWLRRNLMGEAEWIGSNGKNHGALPDAARFATEHLAPSSRWPVNWSRPALRMSYTRIDSSAYLFLDKFDRRQVEWFYADNVGGYTREEVAEMIK